jgi:hypothetical protein
MSPAVRRLAAGLIFALLLGTARLPAQGEQGTLTGQVTDASGAALPGVTVTLASSASPPQTVVTDGAGVYRFTQVAPDTYHVTFELAGFESAAATGVVVRPGEAVTLDRQLGLAALSETVTVVAVTPKPTPPPPPPPPPKLPDAIPVPPELLASVCGPSRPAARLVVGRVVRHRRDAARRLFGPGDVLVLDVGADHAVAQGQNFVVRRRFQVGDKTLPPKLAEYGEHAAALLQVVEADRESSLAVVVYACSEFESGDALEPFDALPMWNAREAGAPQFDDPARILFGDSGRTMGGPSQLMVIDRGTNDGAERGQPLTIFRRVEDDRIVTIADAVVVAVTPESATIRIERANDAVNVGDLVALHR